MPRTTVFAIVEGQTENAVLTKLLGFHLADREIDLHCPIVKLGAGRGGTKGLRCDDLCDQIRRFLRDRRQPVVTTFFDYYALPSGLSTGWDFVQTAKANASAHRLEAIVQSIERAIYQLAIQGVDLPNIADRFIPYV